MKKRIRIKIHMKIRENYIRYGTKNTKIVVKMIKYFQVIKNNNKGNIEGYEYKKIWNSEYIILKNPSRITNKVNQIQKTN